MTDYNRPSDLPAWAESGDKVQPTNSEIQTGWINNGIPPSRQRFNWILNWVANAARYFMQLGVPEYSGTETYRAGSRVQYSGVTYKALGVVSNVIPGTDATKWEKWGFLDSELQPRVDKVLTKSVAGSADVTLTAAEADNGIIILTGILTGNVNVIFPNVGRRWTIYNGTTGSFTVGAKTTAGSAVTVKQGDSNNVYCDGSNAMRLSGSGNNTAITSTDFTATAGQTVFSVSYTPGNVLVFRNGTKVPFTGTNGTSITLATGASAGDIVTVVAFSSFSVANALPLSGGTMAGPLYGPSSTTETSAGLAEVATQAETDAGTDDQRIVTPKKLRWGFAASLGASGYVAFPSWLGAFIIQWGGVTSSASADVTFTFPLAFPTACFRCLAVQQNTPTGSVVASVASATTTSVPVAAYTTNTAARVATSVSVFAIGN